MLKKTLNIPRNLKPLIIMLGVLGLCFSKDAQISNKTFLFCLKPHVLPFDIVDNDDGLSVGNRQVNRFIQKNGLMA